VTAFDVLVVGDCNPDLVLRGDDVEPVFGQVERIVDEAELTIGGSGAIAACAVARLGLRVGFVSTVGDDPFGRFMLDALAGRGVDVSGIAVCPGERTGVTVALVRGTDRAILTALGTIASLSADAVDRDILRSARHVHVSSYFLHTALRPGLAGLLREARAAGASTSVDPNWDPAEEWDGGLLDLLPETSVLFLNAEEAKRIGRADDVETAAVLLARRGAAIVAVKLGGDGALAVEGGRVFRSPARPVEAVDAIGAGDSFDAGFLLGFLGGRPLAESLALANSCGALSMRAAGGTAAQPTLAEAVAG
jgi:sugar/nucleoside kinase (ribokinase family)